MRKTPSPSRSSPSRLRIRKNRPRHKFVIASIAVLLLGSGCIPTVKAADGDLDPTFDGDGKVRTGFFDSFDVGNDLVIQPDGKIVVAGVSARFAGGSLFVSDFALVRYNQNGSLDQTFGTGGKVNTDFQDSSIQRPHWHFRMTAGS